ncbi:MAG: Gfo/Idh/MocA family oxidoreductase, partial [Lachnospiraceae bacterium]|nr:Gfo/Idh/MocA family oxidoreductase [Lachnospiraceae bacterium]
MDEIRLGTIGSGVIVHSVLDAVKRTEGIRLYAVYSRTVEKAKELGDQYGADKTYTDMAEFLADEAVNTVYVASPNSLHYQQVKAALLEGKNVICEKPFCTSKKDAEELMKLAEEKGLLLTEAAPTSFLPNYEVLKNKLPQIGSIKLVISNYSQYSSRYDVLKKGEVPNIFNPEYAGGCLMDINFYNIYLNVALFGKPLRAEYHPNLFTLPDGRGRTDTSGVMLMEYDGFVSTNAGAKDTFGVNFFQIEGEKGYIYITDGSNGLKEIRVVTKTSDETFNEQEDPDRW